MMAKKSTIKKLSPALEKYLAIIFKQEFERGACRASKIAEEAKVSRSSVTSALKELSKGGYIEYEPYSLIHLTEKGLHAGQAVVHRNVVWREFFQHVLQLPEERAKEVAHELEHVVSASVVRRLGEFVLYLNNSPHDWQGWQEDGKGLRNDHVQHQRLHFSKGAPPAIREREKFIKDTVLEPDVLEQLDDA